MKANRYNDTRGMSDPPGTKAGALLRRADMAETMFETVKDREVPLAEQAAQWRTYADGVRGVLEGGVFCGA